VRFNVKGFEEDDPCFDWAVGYHGTAPDAIVAIATAGLRTPNERGVRASHGQAGANVVGGTIYTSPCIEYSAHPVYTPLTPVQEDPPRCGICEDPLVFEAIKSCMRIRCDSCACWVPHQSPSGDQVSRWTCKASKCTVNKIGRCGYDACVGCAPAPSPPTFAQILLQVRVNPKAINTRLGSTLGATHWPGDVPFSEGFGTTDDMEWLVSDSDALIVTGVMFRELGRATVENEGMYGITASSFSPKIKGPGCPPPEFQWTERLSAHLRSTAQRDAVAGEM
jgi:hypothetical protein